MQYQTRFKIKLNDCEAKIKTFKTSILNQVYRKIIQTKGSLGLGLYCVSWPRHWCYSIRPFSFYARFGTQFRQTAPI